MEYTINAHGNITDPGKFEGSRAWVPSFYDLIMDGGGDEDCGDCSTMGRIDTAFFLGKDDADRITQFPELANVECVVITETDDGFVSGCTCTMAEWNHFRDEQESAFDDSDENEDFNE